MIQMLDLKRMGERKYQQNGKVKGEGNQVGRESDMGQGEENGGYLDSKKSNVISSAYRLKHTTTKTATNLSVIDKTLSGLDKSSTNMLTNNFD